MNCSNLVNPYGEGKSAEKIVSLIESIDIQNLPLPSFAYNSVTALLYFFSYAETKPIQKDQILKLLHQGIRFQKSNNFKQEANKSDI